ncbi:hypothetical protein PYW08_012239 [Mythimna loreyi]|uniref:Uncharacterized protein n=1 Tax=Mythimna loreyi TaxID=667449 RepID=A0ACC2Q042_9NEOP|nr:hypothetical protein PYW08_012239 [Mythimna loreyi]
MMDQTEIKCEFPDYGNQCCVCLSVGRKLSLLGEFINVYKIITSDIPNHDSISLEDIKLCWECKAFLRRASIFQQQAAKANEMLQLGQSYLFGTQSSLTTIILNDTHPNTIYVNNLQVRVQTDPKICDGNSEDDEMKDASDDFADDCTKIEEITKESTGAAKTNADCTDHTTTDNFRPKDPSELRKYTDQTKPKSTRWATKRALQNKKPKFKIITECSKDCFRKTQVDDEELKTLIKSERDSLYFMSKRFKCQKCVLTFTSRDVWEKHDVMFHSKVTKYICDICASNIANKRLLSQHIRAHYNKYSCTLCDFSCYDKSQIKWHSQRRHRKIFQCLKCELKFRSRWEFFKHYKEWHEKFICDYCGISFKMRYCIKNHIRKQHSPFECKPCNKRWARYNGLWLHNKTAHNIGVAAYCVECDKQYRDVYRYRWHLANSTRHRQHKKHRIPCPGCDKVFSKNIYMKDHYNLVHLKFYKYRCEQCDKNFIRNADLVKHTRRVHEGILPPKNKICYICGRGFSTNKILTNHLRTHTGEKPFICTICSARFAQSTALSAHARAIHHTVIKPS